MKITSFRNMYAQTPLELLLVAVVRKYCFARKMLKTELIGFASSFLSLAFQLGGGCRGPGPPSYACGLMITVQVCSHINYKICHNQSGKEHLP